MWGIPPLASLRVGEARRAPLLFFVSKRQLAALPGFALHRMGAALDDQLPGPDRFSARGAHCARMELAATRGLEDARRGARVQLRIAPFLERKDDGAKLEPCLGQVILAAGRV